MYKHGMEVKNLTGLWKWMHHLKVFLILFYITSPDITDLGFVFWVLFLICVL